MPASRKWFKTAYPGVRYREHSTRKNGVLPDRYFAIRSYCDGKEREEGLGWASEGWTAKKAASLLADIKQAQTTGTGPQSLAETREANRLGRLRAKQQQRIDSVVAMPFCLAAFDHYLPWARRHKSSWPEDVSRFEYHLLPILGDIPLRKLTRGHIESMIDSVARKGLAPATVMQCLALARRICNFCSRITLHGEPLLPGRNPCEGVTVRRPDNARLRFLTYAEADRLILAAKDIGPDKALHDMIVLALNTGMRLGEMQRLCRPDVDLAHNLLHVLDHDGKPGGVVYLNSDSRAVLVRRLDVTRNGPLVFVPPAGGRVRENISQRFKEVVDALGFNDRVDDPRQRVVFHTLRHTFASWLALAGCDIFRIKELMRHKTITMTMRYAHLIPDAKRLAVENLRPTAPPDSPKA